MARYKHYDYNQTRMIPLRFAGQIQPGSFEYTLNHVVDNDLDLSVFKSRYRNDYNGAPVDDPAILLKNHLIRIFTWYRFKPQNCARLPGECNFQGKDACHLSLSFSVFIDFGFI